MDTLPRLEPSLSIRCTRRAWISSFMRGPSFWTGGAVLIGRRMAKLLCCCTSVEHAGTAGKPNPKTIGIIPAQVNGGSTRYFAEQLSPILCRVQRRLRHAIPRLQGNIANAGLGY